MYIHLENSLLKAIDGCSVTLSLRTHSPMQKVLHLLPENVMFCGDDLIPGLHIIQSKTNESKN